MEILQHFGSLVTKGHDKSIKADWTDTVINFCDTVQEYMEFDEDLFGFNKYWDQHSTPKKSKKEVVWFLKNHFAKVWESFCQVMKNHDNEKMLSPNSISKVHEVKSNLTNLFMEMNFITGRTMKLKQHSPSGVVHMVQVLRTLSSSPRTLSLFSQMLQQFDVNVDQFDIDNKVEFRTMDWIQRFLWNGFFNAYINFYSIQYQHELWILQTLRKDAYKPEHGRDIKDARKDNLDIVEFNFPLIGWDHLNSVKKAHKDSTVFWKDIISDEKRSKKVSRVTTPHLDARFDFAVYHCFLRDVLSCLFKYGINPKIPGDDNLDKYLRYVRC